MNSVIGVDFTHTDQGQVVVIDTKAKRRCTRQTADGQCITILNRFNPGPECLLHAAQTEAAERADGLNPFPARFLERAA